MVTQYTTFILSFTHIHSFDIYLIFIIGHLCDTVYQKGKSNKYNAI